MEAATVHSSTATYIAVYSDFQMLADDHLAGALALRIGEVKTNEIIAYYRELWPEMPGDAIPYDEFLWFDMDYRTFQKWSRNVRARTAFTEMLSSGQKYTGLLLRKRLMQSRWVYFVDLERGDYLRSDQVRYNLQGKAYVITDSSGKYKIGDELHEAPQDGFLWRRRQWLYCLDAVNAALARLDGRTAEPATRWRPEKATPPQTTMTTTAKQRRSNVPGVNTVTTMVAPSAQGGSIPAAEQQGHAVFKNHDTMQSAPLQGLTRVSENTSVQFRSAALTPETIIGLASHYLPVPRREECDDATWERDWQRPAEQLFGLPQVVEKLTDGRPALAWRVIERNIAYMATPGSPSWWQHRARNTPITLRHVYKQFLVQQGDAQLHQWYPEEPVLYDGPTPESAQLVGMSEVEAQVLSEAICEEYPGVSPQIYDIEAHPGRVMVYIEYAPEEYCDFYAPDDWHRRSPETEEILQIAIAYSVARAELAEGNVYENSQGPPGGTEE